MDENDPVLGAVARQIALTITVDVEQLYHVPALNGRFPDGGVDRLFVPHGLARQTSPFRESGEVRNRPSTALARQTAIPPT